MHVWPALLVSLLMLLVAAVLMLLHWRTWRLAQRQELEADGLRYRRHQFRRRMQTSGLLGLLGAALFVGRLITGPPLMLLLFWGAVLLVLGWVFLLAVVDIWATKHHFARLQRAYRIEEAKLQAEIRRIQAARRNGESKKS
jgi:protein-S-isoprenylcysteine O-methyltransferase Ste14